MAEELWQLREPASADLVQGDYHYVATMVAGFVSQIAGDGSIQHGGEFFEHFADFSFIENAGRSVSGMAVIAPIMLAHLLLLQECFRQIHCSLVKNAM